MFVVYQLFVEKWVWHNNKTIRKTIRIKLLEKHDQTFSNKSIYEWSNIHECVVSQMFVVYQLFVEKWVRHNNKTISKIIRIKLLEKNWKLSTKLKGYLWISWSFSSKAIRYISMVHKDFLILEFSNFLSFIIILLSISVII